MKQLILSVAALLLTTYAPAENRTYRPEVKSLQAVVNYSLGNDVFNY